MEAAYVPATISHGLIELDGLTGLNIHSIRCYESDPDHTGVTLFGPGEGDEWCVYIQMYKLPKAQVTFDADLAFQADKKPWGKNPAFEKLKSEVPAGWAHQVYRCNPHRTIHVYKNSERAMFVRYTAETLDHPALQRISERLRIVPQAWAVQLTGERFVSPRNACAESEKLVGPPAVLRLKAEQRALKEVVLNAVKRFAAEQRQSQSDVHKLPVTGIVVFFDVGNGHVSVHFDVRVPFENDGDYSHQEYGALPRENWRQFCEWLGDSNEGMMELLDGRKERITEDEGPSLDGEIGAMIVALLKSLREDGAFNKLLLAKRVEFIVEEDDGGFAWAGEV